MLQPIGTENVGNCSSDEYTQKQKNRIIAYLQEVSKLKPPSVRDWDTLRHYLYFVYRQLISPDPCDKNQDISAGILKEMRDLIEG